MDNLVFKDFKADLAGYAELMNGSGIQQILDNKANGIARRADANLSRGGYVVSGHTVKSFQGKLAKCKAVVTRTEQAKRSQAKRKTLTCAIG